MDGDVVLTAERPARALGGRGGGVRPRLGDREQRRTGSSVAAPHSVDSAHPPVRHPGSRESTSWPSRPSLAAHRPCRRSSRRCVPSRRRPSVVAGRSSSSACVLVAVGIVAAAAIGPILDHVRTAKFSGKPLTEIGAPASVCTAGDHQARRPASRSTSGRRAGHYTDSPPAFGKHYITPDAMARKFYTDKDRPALGTLVHNEEHGYTILWYDDTIAKDAAKIDPDQGDRRQVRRHLRPARQVQGRAVEGLRRRRVPERPARRLHALVGRRHPGRRGRARPSRSACGSTAPTCRARRCRPT